MQRPNVPSLQFAAYWDEVVEDLRRFDPTNPQDLIRAHTNVSLLQFMLTALGAAKTPDEAAAVLTQFIASYVELVEQRSDTREARSDKRI